MDEKWKAPLRLVIIFVIVLSYNEVVTGFLDGVLAFIVVIACSLVTWIFVARVLFPHDAE